jgi:hypothetical protein
MTQPCIEKQAEKSSVQGCGKPAAPSSPAVRKDCALGAITPRGNACRLASLQLFGLHFKLVDFRF